jgi:pyruvate formate-lyase activating enzyme-like uncharacterized protein
MKDKDNLSWYARKADGMRNKIASSPAVLDVERAQRVDTLLSRLKAGGIKGSIAERTLYTRGLPPGCRGCLGGKGTNLYVTGHCTRECFFCFNQKPRTDQLVVHGIPIKEPEEAGEIVRRYKLRSVGISGGEPLLYPERVLRIIKTLRALPERIRIDVYSNGDEATGEILASLKKAGLDAIRFNLVARGFELSPVRRALEFFDEVAVEIPVVPDQMRRLKRMVDELDEMGVPFLNLHELFTCRENAAKVSRRGFSANEEEASSLQWKPVAEGEAAALELLLYALETTNTLSTYYCSCGTQERISRAGLRRRQRLMPDAN